MLRLFFKKILVFGFPFLIYVALIIIIDPFNYFNLSGLTDSNVKFKVSSTVNYGLWKVLRIKENISPDVIIGDSRIADMDLKTIDSATNRKFCDFSIGGGTTQEVISSFNLIKENAIVMNIYLGVCYNVNPEKTKNRVEGALDIVRNPLLYFSNLEVLQCAFNCIFYKNTDVYGEERTNQEQENRWKSVLEKTGNSLGEKSTYPESYLDDIAYIATESNKYNKKLYIIFTPNHKDYHDLIKNRGLDSSYLNFKLRLSGIQSFKFVDLDNEETLIFERKNFNDIFHIKKNILTGLFLSKVIK